MIAPRTVLLHVGTPKTGTSFVQDLLFRNRERLAEQGVLYPADRFDAHFLAALDLMGLTWGGLERQAVGAWDELAGQVRRWEGTVIVSHEILALASTQQVDRALASFGDAEVHLVVSVRDLVRQIPAEWQENVKHRRLLTYRQFLAAIQAEPPERDVATWFWGVQDVPAILRRWGREIPPDRVHVVTVPKPGAPPWLLWERFAQAFRLDPAEFDPAESERSNPSLGVVETDLVRRINMRVNDGVLVGEHYREFVRELLVHRTLSQGEGSARLVLPQPLRNWAAARSEEWVEALSEPGYDVIGDLAELLPDAEDPTPFVDPDRTTPRQREEPAMTALVTLLKQAGDLRDEVTTLREELARTRDERDVALREAGLVTRAKRAVVRREDTSRTVALALSGYRALRRR